MVRLREITAENPEDVLKLEVEEHQKRFVSSIAHSLATAYVYRDTAFPYAVYAGDVPVGLIMFGFYAVRRQYTRWKFLIDKRWQRRGYGREALLAGIEAMKQRFHVRELYLGVALENEAAQRLYRSVGFRSTGLIEDTMREMKWTSDQSDAFCPESASLR